MQIGTLKKELEVIQKKSHEFEDVIQPYDRVIILGNGGSNSVASHIAQDYTKILGKNEPVQTQWRFKPPEGNGFPYHQDDFWTRAGHGNTINVLVHFEKTNELNGCIKVLPESHNPPFHSDGVSLNCDKGDITILHNHLIHWSDKNTSLDWRRNLLVMYVKNNIDYIRGENAKRKTIQKT